VSERLPCGRCDIGIYAVQPILNGVKTYRGCATKKDALRQSPRCKLEPGKVCAGAVDFVAGLTFPVTDEQCDQIEQWCHE